MDFTKEEIIKELDLLVTCLCRFNHVVTIDNSTMEESVDGEYIELNDLEDKVENLKSKILGE